VVFPFFPQGGGPTEGPQIEEEPPFVPEPGPEEEPPFVPEPGPEEEPPFVPEPGPEEGPPFVPEPGPEEEPPFVPEPGPEEGPPFVPEPDRITSGLPGGKAVEDTLSTIDENTPFQPSFIIGVIGIAAIGAGVALYAKRRSSRSHQSTSIHPPVHENDMKKDETPEDVEIIAQGGIEKV
jgi:hypothetical protein